MTRVEERDVERDGGSGQGRWSLRAYGPSAVLVEVADHRLARDLALWVRTSGVRCAEVVPAATSVLIDGFDARDEVLAALRAWEPGPDVTPGRVEVELPVTYDGEDLPRVARLWGVDEAEVVARHTSTEFVSAFCGFAPGFAYLAGLPAEWAVPRLGAPRARVPAGAVALADSWCGVYPGASPGGWLLLGTTRTGVWDPSRRESPALLAPGTRVRFVVA